MAEKFKTSWKHPRSKRWHLLDYIITKRRDLKDIKVTRAMRGASCWTDHNLIRAKLCLHVKRKQRHHCQVTRKFAVQKLENPTTAEYFNNTFREALDKSTHPQHSWTRFQGAIAEASKQVLGYKKNTQQDWFVEHDDEIEMLLNEKRTIERNLLEHPNDTKLKLKLKAMTRTIQRNLRSMKNKWWENRASYLQQLADNHDKRFFSELKAVIGPSKSPASSLRSLQGILLFDMTEVRERWKEHFEQLLNRDAVVDKNSIDAIIQHPMQWHLEKPPDTVEIDSAIKSLKLNKAPGRDGIPAEIYKIGGTQCRFELQNVISKIWSDEIVPSPAPASP
ncbi:MAG: hypothetical protein AAF412_03965 [Pseudomonadota bacterium]